MEDLRFKGGHYEYPHTANYETDLTFLIHRYKDLKGDYETLIDIYKIIKDKITEVTLEQLQEWLDDGTIDNIINEKIFGELNDRVNANTENIEILKTKVDTNASDISKLKDDVKTNSGNIADNSNKIADNSKNIANNQRWSVCDTVTTKGKIRVIANPAIWSSTNLTMGLNGICFADNNKVVQVFCSSTGDVKEDTTSIMVGTFNGINFSNMVELPNLPFHGNSITYIGGNICLIVTVTREAYVLDLADNSVTAIEAPASFSGIVSCELGLYGTAGDYFYKLDYSNGRLSIISSTPIIGAPTGQVNQGLGYSNGHFLMPISRYNTILALNSDGQIVKNMALTGSTAGELEDLAFYRDRLFGAVNVGNPNFNNGYFSFITEVDIFGHSEILGATDTPSFARGNPLINLYQEKEIQLKRDNSFTRVYLRDGMLYLPTTGVKPITGVMSHILVRWSGASAEGGEQTFFTDVLPLADFNSSGTDGKASVTRSRIYSTGDVRHYSWNYNVSSSDNPWIDVGEPKLVTASIGGNNTLNTSGVEIIIHEVIGVRTN